MNHRGTENTEISDRLEELNQLTRKIIGAAMEVHKQLGPGYLESVYKEALAHEFDIRKIPYQRQPEFGINFKGKKVGLNQLDFLVDKKVVVELKAVDALLPIHKATVISFLKATDVRLGLLINFNVIVLKEGIKRLVRGNPSELSNTQL